MSGFGSGSLWGLILGGVGLVFVSQVNEQPAGNEPPLAPQLTAPTTAQAEQIPEGLTASLNDFTREFLETAPRVAVPEAEVQAPETDTTPAPPPTFAEVATTLSVPENVSNPKITAGLEEPEITRAVTSTPTVPMPEEDVTITTQPAQAPLAVAPDTTDVAGVSEDTAIQPESEAETQTQTQTKTQQVVDALTETVEIAVAETLTAEENSVEQNSVIVDNTSEVIAEAPIVVEPVTPSEPEVMAEEPVATPQTTDSVALPQVVSPDPETEPTPQVAETPSATDTLLPQVGTGVRVNRPVTEPPETAGQDAEVIGESELSENTIALERYAVAFDRSGDQPLISIILLDNVDDPDVVARIASLPFPKTVIIDALAADASGRMAQYRAAGVEVAMQTVLPSGAVPTDVEVAFEAAFDILPEAVALFSGADGILQGNRAVSEQVIEVLQSEGRGLVVVQRGFGNATRQAEQIGLRAIAVERELDGADESAAAIARALDQAAFRARQSGDTVLLARAIDTTIAALASWSAQNDGDQIALAPVSAILLGREEAN